MARLVEQVRGEGEGIGSDDGVVFSRRENSYITSMEEDVSVAGKEKGSLMFRQLSESELCGGTTHPSAYATCYLGGPSLIFVVMTPSRAWMFSFVDVQDRGKLIPKIQTLIDSCRLGASASSASKMAQIGQQGRRQ